MVAGDFSICAEHLQKQRQTQEDAYEFKAILVYKGNSGQTKVT